MLEHLKFNLNSAKMIEYLINILSFCRFWTQMLFSCIVTPFLLQVTIEYLALWTLEAHRSEWFHFNLNLDLMISLVSTTLHKRNFFPILRETLYEN